MGTLQRKISNKIINAKKEGLKFNLSESDVIQLMKDAGIAENDWSFYGWHLTRIEDKGDYDVGNCRFLPCSENYREKKISDKSRAASRRNILKAMSTFTPEFRSEVGRLGGFASKRGVRHAGLEDSELLKRFELVKHLDKTLHGYYSRVGRILGCTHTHAKRLLKRWESSGLV